MNAIVSAIGRGFETSRVDAFANVVRVGAVAGHAVVQRRAAGHEAVGLGVVDAVDQTHELARDVAMEPRRTERVLAHQPARRKDHEVDHVDAGRVGRRLQHEEDRRIGMVVADRADRVEAARGRTCTARSCRARRRRRAASGRSRPPRGCPGTWRRARTSPRGPRTRRRAPGSRAGWRGRSSRSGRGRAGERRAEVLADVAARGAVDELDAEAHAARHDGDLLRLDVDEADLGREAEPPLLRHDQQLAVGVREEPIGHRPVRGVDVDAAAALRLGIAVAGHRDQALDEVRGLGRDRERIPAELVRRRDACAEVAREEAVVDPLERLVQRGRADAIQPRAAVRVARRGERRAGDLLGVQPVRAALRRVLSDRQRAGRAPRSRTRSRSRIGIQGERRRSRLSPCRARAGRWSASWTP